MVISTTGAADRAGALATYFTAGYVGVSLPVVGLGLALQQLSPRVTLLIFAALVGTGFLAVAPILAGAKTAESMDTATHCRRLGTSNEEL